METIQTTKWFVGAMRTATNALTTGVCTLISLKNAVLVRIHIFEYIGAAAATVWQPEKAETVGGTPTNITTVVRIWKNDDTLTDTLAKQTDATSYTQAATTTNKHIVFEVDPTTLIYNVAGSAPVNYDCVGVYASTGSGSNYATIAYEVISKYPQATPPSVIID